MMTITLYYTQLEHTIVQVLHRAGARLEDADLRDNAQMDEKLSDKQLIRRLIRTGVAKVRVLLRDYSPETDATGAVADDKLRDDEASWVFTLNLTGNGQSLADLLHWFVTWSALRSLAADLGLTDLTRAAGENAADAEGIIKDELVALSMPVKRRRVIPQPEDYSPIIELAHDGSTD